MIRIRCSDLSLPLGIKVTDLEGLPERRVWSTTHSPASPGPKVSFKWVTKEEAKRLFVALGPETGYS